MRKCLVGLAVIVTLVTTRVVCAEEGHNYWAEIRHHLEMTDAVAPGSPAAKKAVSYIESLSAGELMIAGRQAASEMQQHRRRDWPIVAMNLGWFYKYYPEKTEGLKDISPLLAEIRNPDRSTYWRWYLGDLLTNVWDREERLTNDQRRKVVACLLPVLGSDKESTPLRAIAAPRIPRLLGRLQTALTASPRRQRHSDEQRALAHLARFYLRASANVLRESDAKREVLQGVVAGLTHLQCAGLPGQKGAAELITAAARDYKRYPEGMWPQLMVAAVHVNSWEETKRLTAEAAAGATDTEVAERLKTAHSWMVLQELHGKTSVTATAGRAGSQAVVQLPRAELLAVARKRMQAIALEPARGEQWAQLSRVLKEYEARTKQQ